MDNKLDFMEENSFPWKTFEFIIQTESLWASNILNESRPSINLTSFHSMKWDLQICCAVLHKCPDIAVQAIHDKNIIYPELKKWLEENDVDKLINNLIEKVRLENKLNNDLEEHIKDKISNKLKL